MEFTLSQESREMVSPGDDTEGSGGKGGLGCMASLLQFRPVLSDEHRVGWCRILGLKGTDLLACHSRPLRTSSYTMHGLSGSVRLPWLWPMMQPFRSVPASCAAQWVHFPLLDGSPEDKLRHHWQADIQRDYSDLTLPWAEQDPWVLWALFRTMSR